MPVTFKGGLHIPDHKEITNKIPIKKIDGDKIHIFPLQQHIGAPLDVLVNVGDYVYKGQTLASSDAFVSAPIHSSISGTVTKIAPHLHPSGAEVTSIFIENDFKNEIHPDIKPYDTDKMSSKEMIEVIKNAGIVGMGGAGFPTHVKLSPPPDKKITHVIVNGADCEPYLTSDHRRMLENAETIIDGLKLAMKILDLDKGYIGVETNKADAISHLKKTCEQSPEINIVPLKTKYPQGAEKQLIYAVTRKRVPSGGLPSDVGAIVLNIDTAVAISNAFRTGMPLTERIITMTGDCYNEPCNLSAPIGAPFSYLIEQAGGFSKEVSKFIMGGPMMGIAQFSTDVPVIKTTSCLLALSDAEATYKKNTPCIRCGKCVSHCPMNLSPVYLSRYALEEDLEKCEKYNILDCIECGLCSYLCPGLQSPVHNIRIAKQKILENRRKANNGK